MNPAETSVPRPYHVGRVRVDRVDGPLATPCHLWRGHLNNCGYGTRGVNKRPWLAHRYAYEQEHGPIPEGYQMHHVCENRACVNVDHLEARPMLDHNRDHFPGPTERAEALLRERGPLHIREIAAAVGGGFDALRVGLGRSIKHGRAVRVSRGVYGPPQNDMAWRGIPFTREGE